MVAYKDLKLFKIPSHSCLTQDDSDHPSKEFKQIVNNMFSQLII